MPRTSPLFVTSIAAWVVLAPSLAFGETQVGGTITGETAWSKDGSPYIVTKDIVVAKGSVLRISRGVTVRFKNDINDQEGLNAFDLEMDVDGTLILEGAEGDTVYFTSDSAQRRWTDWQGIYVRKGGTAKIHAAHIEFCNEGIRIQDGNIEMTHSTVQYCNNYGLRFMGGTGKLDNVFVTSVGNAGGTGVGVSMERRSDVSITRSLILGVQNGISFIQESKGTVDATIVSDCVGPGILVRKSTPTITASTITNNQIGLYVTAYSKPVVRNNNVFLNQLAELILDEYGETPVKLDFSNNWWGDPAVYGLLDDRVLDALDEPKRGGFALLDPPLAEAYNSESEGGAPPEKP